MLETIKIVADTELGYMIINLSDYDKSTHIKYYENKDSSEQLEESENETPKRKSSRSKV